MTMYSRSGARRKHKQGRTALQRLKDRCFCLPARPDRILQFALPLLVLSLISSLPRAIAQPVSRPLLVPPTSGKPLPPQPPETKPTPKANPDEFPPNPLESTAPDPLLPREATQRPLTAAEQKQLALALDGLNNQATAKLNAGDRAGAFELWYRELRLRRSLGLVEEVRALGRVGDVAWRENRTADIRWLTRRLDAILTQTEPKLSPAGVAPANEPVTAAPVSSTAALPDKVSSATPDRRASVPRSTATPSPSPASSGNGGDRTAVLEALGLAYQQVRLPQVAASIYQQILAEAKQRQNEKKVDETLITLGQLRLSWFDYPNAAIAYQELLSRARARSDRQNEIIYLTQLAYTYEQAKQPEQAIAYEQQIVAFYQALPNPAPIPALKIKIADNYQQLARLNEAEQNYQSAYQLAQPLFQFAYASDALHKLGALYRANDRLDAALKVFDYLVGLEQQAYNLYGMMTAYDQIGQIQLARKQNQQALVAFAKGLSLAKQLKYRQDYFTAQIQKISQ